MLIRWYNRRRMDKSCANPGPWYRNNTQNIGNRWTTIWCKTLFPAVRFKSGRSFSKHRHWEKWVVRRMSRWNIVKMCRDDHGRSALERTFEKIRVNYWIKGMRRFVSTYFEACLTCLYYKSKSGRKPGFLHPIDKVPILFHTFHLDHIGRFIRTTHNTHILTIVKMDLSNSVPLNLYGIPKKNISLKHCTSYLYFLKSRHESSLTKGMYLLHTRWKLNTESSTL